MDMEKYSDRMKGFIQSAQTGALAAGHQQFLPEHLLKVLLDDSEGLCAGLVQRAGGDLKRLKQDVERLGYFFIITYALKDIKWMLIF